MLKPNVFDYLDDNADMVMWEEDPMTKLTSEGELVAYKYKGFWKCMDALRDKIELEDLWKKNNAKWKIW